MVKTLLKSVRQYKRASIETPVFVAMEVVLECTIPLIMSKLIDDMTGTSMTPILKYGVLLLVLATMSLCVLESSPQDPRQQPDADLQRTSGEISILKPRISRLRISTSFHRPLWSRE